MKKECVDIKPLLYAYVDNELSKKESSIVISHISNCDSCKASLTSICKVKDMIKSVYVPKDDIDLSAKIMVNIKLNNKYAKNNKVDSKVVHKKSFRKIVARKLLYIASATAIITFIIGATIVYFEKFSSSSLQMADQNYDKFEDYVIEHYTNSYSSPSARASVLSVNFEK